MSDCLGAEPQLTQQERIAYCNRDAGTKTLKGEARKAFISECLKAK